MCMGQSYNYFSLRVIHKKNKNKDSTAKGGNVSKTKGKGQRFVFFLWFFVGVLLRWEIFSEKVRVQINDQTAAMKVNIL